MRKIGINICFHQLSITQELIFLKYETITKETQKIIANRNFAYKCFMWGKVPAEKPQFCPVCDTNSEGSKECKFYSEDSRLAYEGKLPAQYDKIRKQFYGKRYDILKEKSRNTFT